MISDLLDKVKSFFGLNQPANNKLREPFLTKESISHSLPIDVVAEVMADLESPLSDQPQPLLGEALDEIIIAEIEADVAIELEDAPQLLLGEPKDETVLAEIEADAGVELEDCLHPIAYNVHDDVIIAEIAADSAVELLDTDSPAVIEHCDGFVEEDIQNELAESKNAQSYTMMFEAAELTFVSVQPK